MEIQNSSLEYIKEKGNKNCISASPKANPAQTYSIVPTVDNLSIVLYLLSSALFLNLEILE